MDVGQGLEVEDHAKFGFFHVISPFSLDKAGDLLFQLFGVGAGAEEDIGKPSIPAHGSIDLGAPSLIGRKGKEDGEFKMGIGRWIGYDGGDLIIVLFVYAYDLADGVFIAEIFFGSGRREDGGEDVL